MTKLQNETFIRSQIRRILLEEEKPEEGAEEPKPKRKKSRTGKKVHGGPRGGDYSAVMKKVFGGGKKADRLAESKPGQLMKNLNVTNVAGNNDQKLIETLLSKAVKGTKEMSEVFSEPQEKKDSAGRWGYFVAAKGLEGRYALLFIYDTVRGAVNAGVLKLDGDVRADAAQGGALVFGVEEKDEKWDQKK